MSTGRSLPVAELAIVRGTRMDEDGTSMIQKGSNFVLQDTVIRGLGIRAHKGE